MEKAVEEQGKAVAKSLDQSTPPYLNRKLVRYLIPTPFAFIINDGPIYLNMVVGDRSVCEAVARLYCPYISDGSFNNHSEEVIAAYYKDTTAEEVIAT